MRRKPLSSTVLASAGHDPETDVLEVEFQTGRVYRYLAVPTSVYEELVNAESRGEYFNREIRNRYQAFEITEGDSEE